MLTIAKPSLALRRPSLRRTGPILVGSVILAYMLYIFVGSNSHAVIDGRVYRTAQLSGDALASYLQSKQVRTVINLRGFCPGVDWYEEEVAATARAGASQQDITFSANRLPPPEELKRLIDVLDHCEYPIVVHCKQGADRTGMVSAIVLLLYTDASLARAKRELWPHRGHFPVGRTLAMDEFFDRYEAWLAASSRTHSSGVFRSWMLEHYQPGPAAVEFAWVTPWPQKVPAGRPFAVTLRATNRSGDPWRLTAGATSGIRLEYRLLCAEPGPGHEDVAGLVNRTVNPGESIEFLLAFPQLKAGTYKLRAELADFTGAAVPVRAQYFFQFGSPPLLEDLIVE